MGKSKKILLILAGTIAIVALVIGIVMFKLNTMPRKNIGKWSSTSNFYSSELRLYDDKKFELTASISYTIGETYQANITYKGTYKYFNGSITLIPDNENIQYKGNFGDNRLTLRKIESDGTSGDFLEYKK